MKSISLFISLMVLSASIYAQKPQWVDNPGMYAYENFVAIGIAKDNKADKVREKAEKKVVMGITKLLKKKYKDSEIKKALVSLRYEAYWTDPATKYTYCLGLLPIETIDKNYAAQKNLLKAKASALDAVKMLNEMNKDPDIVIIRAEEEISIDSESASKDDEVLADYSGDQSTEKIIAGKPTGTRSLYGKNKSLGEFQWLDQDANSKYEFLGEQMVITVAQGEYFLPEENIRTAPRIEMKGIKGDFSIEGAIHCNWAKYYATGFGFYVNSGQSIVQSFVSSHGTTFYLKGYDKDIALPVIDQSIETPKGKIYLKLERKSFTFTAWYSTIPNEWLEIGSFDTKFPQDVSVGVYFFNDSGTPVQFKLESLLIQQ